MTTNTHKKRTRDLDEILDTCEKNSWTYDTAYVQLEIEDILLDKGYSSTTARDRGSAVMRALLREKETGARWRFGIEAPEEETEEDAA